MLSYKHLTRDVKELTIFSSHIRVIKLMKAVYIFLYAEMHLSGELIHKLCIRARVCD